MPLLLTITNNISCKIGVFVFLLCMHIHVQTMESQQKRARHNSKQGNVQQKTLPLAPDFIRTTNDEQKNPLPPFFIRTTKALKAKPFITQAPLCQMPSENVLRQRLNNYTYLLNHSDLLERLASKKLTALDIERETSQALANYIAFITEEKWSDIAIEAQEYYNQGILPILLVEYPKEVTRLTLLGLCKHNKTQKNPLL